MKSVRNLQWETGIETRSLKDVFKHLLAERKLKPKKIPEKNKNMGSGFFSDDLLDPFLLHGMRNACSRIQKAIQNKERIMVFGDFDADGVTSTVVLFSALQSLGAEVSYRIPDRTDDGHGLKSYLIDEISETRTSLVISCDCGVNDSEAVAHAKKNGIDVIITDHHEPDENRFPEEAVAVINPKLSPEFPDKNLSGSAVAFKLVQALLIFLEYGDSKSQEFFLDKLIEVAAIGVVSDCVPLVGENRVLVQKGLQKMKNSSWEGLRMLLENEGISLETVDEETIGFVIAPRINAASRLGDVRMAVQLFLGNSEAKMRSVEYLNALNQLRKELTAEGIAEARDQIIPENSCQIFFNPEWKQGVVGLIATRYVQELGVPTIVCTQTKKGEISASCRSPKGICIATALQKSQEFLPCFGGHAGAAGFVTQKEHFKPLKASLNEYFEAQKIPEKRVSVSAFLSLSHCGDDLADFLEAVAPFGVGNPRPIFGFRDFLVTNVLPLGKSGEHFKIQGTQNGEKAELVSFFSDEYIEQVFPGKKYEILFEFRRKMWRGKTQFEYKFFDARLQKED